MTSPVVQLVQSQSNLSTGEISVQPKNWKLMYFFNSLTIPVFKTKILIQHLMLVLLSCSL